MHPDAGVVVAAAVVQCPDRGGMKKVHLVSEGDLARDYPEFELGAVPPIEDVGVTRSLSTAA